MRQRRAATSHVPSSPALGALLLALALGGVPLASRPAAAQLSPGLGDDAYVLPSRVLRLTFAPTLESADERFRSDGTREPLGAGVSGQWNGTRLGFLARGQQALRSLTGDAGATLSLGDVQVTANRRSTILPLVLEYGLFGRVQLGVTVPFVRTATDVVASANGARDASAGLNPALFGTTDAETASAQNTAVVNALRSAARSREADAGLADGGCATSTVAACTLVNEARQAATDVERLYGTADVPGSAAVPRVGSGGAAAVDARLAALRGSLGIGTALVPYHARLPIGRSDLTTLVTDEAAGLGLDDFRLVERSHFGDVEGSIKLLLLDRIGPVGAAPRNPVGLRVAVGAVVRAPTGQGEQPGNPLDVGTGDGQTDLELRGALDVTLGRHLWLTGAVRTVTQRADDQWVRVPASASEEGLSAARTAAKLRRDLGDAVQVEATTRWLPNAYLSFAATYQYRRKDEDSYTDPLDVLRDRVEPSSLPALGAGTGVTEQRVGVGATWSTLAAGRRGQRVLPIDVSLLHLETVRATGGIAPRLTTDVLRLRWWWGAARDARR